MCYVCEEKEVRPNGEYPEVSMLLRRGWAVSVCRTEQSLKKLTEVVVSGIPKQKQAASEAVSIGWLPPNVTCISIYVYYQVVTVAATDLIRSDCKPTNLGIGYTNDPSTTLLTGPSPGASRKALKRAGVTAEIVVNRKT